MLYRDRGRRGTHDASSPSRLVLDRSGAGHPRIPRAIRVGILCGARLIRLWRSCATELADSGLRERDPDAYRQRAFELSVAGYFADPAAAHDLTPFRVTGRVQQTVWESLGDFDLLADGSLQTVTDSDARRARAAGSYSARVVPGSGERDESNPGHLDGSGHVPYVEQPDELFSAIRRFLQETQSATTRRVSV